MVELRSITSENFHHCLALDLQVEDSRFVDPIEYSLAEVWLYGAKAHPFAIYNEEQIIGFVLLYVEKEHYQIINLVIDGAFRNKKYGTRAVALCKEYLKSKFQAKKVSVPVNLENYAAQKFWKNQGFDFSDTIEDGYVFMRCTSMSNNL